MDEHQPNTHRPIAAKTHPEYTKYTILTVLVPILGIIFGIVYSVRSDPQDKKLGEHLLAELFRSPVDIEWLGPPWPL